VAGEQLLALILQKIHERAPMLVHASRTAAR
jgi:hypothetical protein